MTTAGARSSAERWIVLGVSTAATMLAWSVRSTFALFYVAMLGELAWGRGPTAFGYSLSWIGFVVFAPLAGWLSDRAGKRNVIIWANVVLAILFVTVARSTLGIGLVLGIAALSIAASARQAPLHALTTEIVGPEIRGEYIAVRNAASQVGIAFVATVSASAFDAAGFLAVASIAALATLLIPLCCVWLKEPVRRAA